MAVLRGQGDLDGGLWPGMAPQARQMKGVERGDKWGPTCQAGGSDGWVSVGVWLVTFRGSGFRSDCCLSRPSSET